MHNSKDKNKKKHTQLTKPATQQPIMPTVPVRGSSRKRLFKEGSNHILSQDSLGVLEVCFFEMGTSPNRFLADAVPPLSDWSEPQK